MAEKKHIIISIAIILTIGLGCFYFYSLVFSVPKNFPTGVSFTVNENESLQSISERLYKDGYITSPLLFRAGVSFLGKDKTIQLGGYVFDTPASILGIIHIFVQGRPTSPLLSVTIPEGSSSDEVATIIAKAFPSIAVPDFIAKISEHDANGKLFPSTYFLLPSYNELDILELMVSTFSKRIESIVHSSKLPEPLKNIDEVIVLASILEGEAQKEEDMKIVAGILITRLNIGMPLQVDVVRDTYKKKGLPKDPINNPGTVAVSAVLNPIYTDYLYYITGKDGNMYYAKTYEEHKRNIQKYLK